SENRGGESENPRGKLENGEGESENPREDEENVGERDESDAIYARLQDIVRQRGRHEPPAALKDIELLPLPQLLADKQAVSAHWPLVGTNPLARARALLRRAERQYLRWLINPIVEQQNAFNAALTAMV